MALSLLKLNRKSSMIVDWVVVILMFFLLFAIYFIKPYERQFSLEDLTISHTHKGDTIPMKHLVLVSLIISIVVILGFQYKKNDMRFNLNQALMGLCVSYTMTTVFTNAMKVAVGRYRPDFISVCKVDFEKVEEHYRSFNISREINYGPRNLFDTSICTAEYSEIRKEQESFPSGHTSFAFSIWLYLILYIAGQIHLFDRKRYFWKYALEALLFLIPIIVGLTRIFDYRHHWEDVLTGAILGCFFAVLTYFFHYPSLYSANCDIPIQRIYVNCENGENGSIESSSDSEKV